MDLQPLTLYLPGTIYQQLVELATKSKRPVAEETINLLNLAIANDTAKATDISTQLEQLSLLTDEELWKAATSKASEEDNDIMQTLLGKRQREGLTSHEGERLQALSGYFNQIMMVRAKSAVVLSNRRHDILPLAPFHE